MFRPAWRRHVALMVPDSAQFGQGVQSASSRNSKLTSHRRPIARPLPHQCTTALLQNLLLERWFDATLRSFHHQPSQSGKR
jgi:hypothetical protein